MTGTDDAAEALKKQLNLLTLQASVTAKQKEMATLSTTAFDAPKGTTTIDGVTTVEGLLLAYRTMEKLAANISDRVKAASPSRVMIYNPADFKAIDALRTFRIQYDLIQAGMDEAAITAKAALQTGQSSSATPKSIVGIPVIGTIISSTLQLATLFRVDASIKESKIEIEDQVLAITVAGALKRLHIDVYNTSIMPILTEDDHKTNLLVQRLDQLTALRFELAGLGNDLAAATKAGGTANASPPGTTTNVAGLISAADKVTAASATFDMFVAALCKLDDASSTTKLAQLLEAGKLEKLLDDKVVFLWLKSVAAGGSSQTRKNIFRTTLSFSGGAIVSYAIYRRHGELLEAATLPLYSGWVKLEDLPSGGLIAPPTTCSMQGF